MEKIRVAVCDDELTICQYYQNIIQSKENMEFVGKTSNTTECIELIKNTKPDILLLDLYLEHINAGIEILPEVKKISPDTKVIVLTMHNSDSNLFAALENGADYFIEKTITSAELVDCIEKNYYFNSELDKHLGSRILEGGINLLNENKSLLYFVTILKNLTKSEIEVLYDLCNGLSYQKIAKKRFVTENTIRSQIARIIKKMNYENIKDLVIDIKKFNILDFFN